MCGATHVTTQVLDVHLSVVPSNSACVPLSASSTAGLSALLHPDGLVLQLVHSLLVQVIKVGVLQCIPGLPADNHWSAQEWPRLCAFSVNEHMHLTDMRGICPCTNSLVAKHSHQWLSMERERGTTSEAASMQCSLCYGKGRTEMRSAGL